MNTELILIGTCLFLLLSLAGIMLLSTRLRVKSIREYDELHAQFNKAIDKAEDSAEELTEDISDITNFTLSYSLYRRARGKERKREASLEMSVWWDKLPVEVQTTLRKIGAEVDLKPREVPA